MAAAQFELDQTACRGETQKAGLGSEDTQHEITLTARGLVSVRGQAMDQVFQGCMAQKGYLRR